MLVAILSPAHAADQMLLLSVQVNGYPLNKVGEFILRDGTLYSRQAELRDLGFRVPDMSADQRDTLIRLSDLRGITWRLDAPKQALHATAPDDRLMPTLVKIRNAPSAPDSPVESGLGTTFNYDVTGTSVAGQNTFAGAFDLRMFSPWGILSTGYLGFSGGGFGGPGASSAIRLESFYTYSDPDTLRRYRLGDFIASGLGWNRSVRLGGAQVTSDFSTRPDLITFPLPSVSGSVAVPSTVDVMVNGNQLLSRQLGAGPFEIPQLPVVTGAGTIAMTMTNALGRPVLVTLPFYASSLLLTPGLQTYSVQVGAVRQNFGRLSYSYDRVAASAAYRRGLTDWLTVEASVESAGDMVMGGGGVAMSLANFAVLNVDAASSKGSNVPTGKNYGGTGTLFSVGIQRSGQVLSVGASATMASRNFRDIATLYGDHVPRLQLNASAGLSLGEYGSFGVAYAHLDRYAVPAPVQVYLPPGSTLSQNASQTGGALSQVGGSFFFGRHRRRRSPQPAIRCNWATSRFSRRGFTTSPTRASAACCSA